MSRLEWKLLTKKRGSSTQGIPSGKEHLAWVTNTVSLIHGERDAVLVELGHTDTSHSTALHVPSLGLVISGDCVYNNTHLYLAECDEKARSGWLQALDRIESLHPTTVVAGHGVLDPNSSPRHIEETRRYLHDFDACAASTSTPLQLYEAMLALHPDRVNPGSLWSAASAAKPSRATTE